MKLELSRNFYTQVAGYAAQVQECFPFRCFPSYLISDIFLFMIETPHLRTACTGGWRSANVWMPQRMLGLMASTHPRVVSTRRLHAVCEKRAFRIGNYKLARL